MITDPNTPWTLYSLRHGDSQRELKDTKEEKSKLKKWKWLFKTRRYLQLTLSPTHYPHFFSPGLCINWKTDDLPHYSLCFQLLNCQKLSVFSLITQTSFCVTTKTFLVHPTSTVFLRRHDFGRKDCWYWTSQKNCEAHVLARREMEIYLKAYLVILLRAIYRYLLLFLLWHVWFEGKHTTRLLKTRLSLYCS